MSSLHVVIVLISLFLAGILAGSEFVVRYGVQPALDSLDDVGTIQARQALIGRLRVIVPAVMVPTVVTSVIALVVSGTGAGFGFRIAGVAALGAFLLLAFLGTVPINIRVAEWDAVAPPADWRAVIRRWALIDVFRSSAAILAFAMFAAALGSTVLKG